MNRNLFFGDAALAADPPALRSWCWGRRQGESAGNGARGDGHANRVRPLIRSRIVDSRRGRRWNWRVRYGLNGVQFLDPTEIDRAARSGVAHRIPRAGRRDGALPGGWPPLAQSLPPLPAGGADGQSRPSLPGFWPGRLRRSPCWVAVYARAYVGDRHDRFRRDHPWPDQLVATADVLGPTHSETP